MPRLALVLVPILASAAAADGPSISDVRLDLGFGRVADSHDAVLYGGSAGVPLTATGSGQRVSVGIAGCTSFAPLGQFGGLIVGGELAWRHDDLDGHDDQGPSDYNVDSTAYALDLWLGWAVAPAPRVHVEIAPLLGIALERSEFELKNSTLGGDSTGDNAFATRYGLRVGAFETFANAWQLGIEGRYAVESVTHRAHLNIPGAGADFQDDADRHAIEFALTIGRRL